MSVRPTTPAALRERLIEAELAFAEFNARRTCAGDGADIQRRAAGVFELLVDPSRPGSAYYHRAVARSPQAFGAAELAELPENLGGIELTPAQASPDLSQALAARGHAPGYALCYLGGLPPAAPLPVGLDVVRLQAPQADGFLDLLEREGVPFPPARRAQKRRFYATDTFQAFVCRDADREPLGWATSYVAGGCAWLGNSFTLPAFRRRGVHAALLAARLNAAADDGVQAVFTDVEHGSQSHDNCERAGLRTLTINTIWTRTP